jgi:hypothetical protein
MQATACLPTLCGLLLTASLASFEDMLNSEARLMTSAGPRSSLASLQSAAAPESAGTV